MIKAVLTSLATVGLSGRDSSPQMDEEPEGLVCTAFQECCTINAVEIEDQSHEVSYAPAADISRLK